MTWRVLTGTEYATLGLVIIKALQINIPGWIHDQMYFTG